MGQNRPIQRPPLSLTFCGERLGCPWLSRKWKSRIKSQNQQHFQCSRRPMARSRQKSWPISIEFMRSVAMHCWWNNGFSRSKNKKQKTSDWLFWNILTSRACQPRATLISRSLGLSGFKVIRISYIRPQKNRVRKRRVVGRIYGIKYSWKGHKRETNTRTE